MAATPTTESQRVHMTPCRDYHAGYDVIDPRDNSTLAWRTCATTAAEIVDYLNREYTDAPLPAHDTLVHEICDLRIAGIAG